MHRLLLACCAVASVLLVAVPAAHAGGLVRGEGFKLRVPGGFERMDLGDRASGIAGQLQLTAGLAVKGEPALHVYYAGLPSRPDAVLLAARIELADDTRMRTRLDLQRYVMDNLRLSPQEFEALVAEGGVKLRHRRRGDYDALEMSHDGSRGALGLLNEPATRALTVLGGEFVLVVVLMVVDDTGVPVEETWQRVSRSLDLAPPGAFYQGVLMYAGGALIVLILVVFLMRKRAQRRRRRPPWARGMVLEDTTPDWGREADARGRDVAAPPPPRAPADEPAAVPTPAAARPANSGAAQPRGGLRSTLDAHRAKHPEAPTAPQVPLATDADEPVPDTTPGRPDESHPVPPSDLESPPPARPPAPQRKGLIRTRPPGGRHSDS